MITDWKLWWREVLSRKFEIRILGAELEILRRTPWSRIREQNSVYKEFLEIVGNGKPTGNVWKETIAVSATISISVVKIAPSNPSPNSFILQQSDREFEVPQAGVPVVECLDGLARIILEELAITHFVKNGTLQNACSTRPRVVVGLGKSALLRIVRLMNNLAKGLKRMVTKVQWLCWKGMTASKNRETCFGRLLIKYTTVGLRISGYGAAEVFIDFTEELRHTETDPMCKIH